MSPVAAAPTTLPEYPKIETIFDRDEKTFTVIDGQFRFPEFGLINRWRVAEKIDGTNVRVGWRMEGDERRLEFGGRTAAAQMPTFLLRYLQDTFTAEGLASVFPDLEPPYDAVLFGEGYGVKIQSGGNYRNEGVAFRLFDVKVGHWWLTEEAIHDIAGKLGISTVPYLGWLTTDEAVELVRGGTKSVVSLQEASKDYVMEGIVARTDPLLLTRRGHRLIWKLKAKDFKVREARNPVTAPLQEAA